MNTLFTFIAASTAFITVASSAQVILFNGTTVTQKLPVEIFLTEGPIWDIDIPGRTLTAVGQVIQIPASIDGVPFTLEGTEKLSPNGATLGSITAADFDRLSDINAVGRDLVNTSAGEDVGPYRLGPVRSIFSTSEARSNVVGALDRSPATQRVIEDNYFRILINLFNVHQSVLSAEFLGRCGVRTAQGQYPTNPFQLPPRTHWKYPHSTGGTLKSAGTIYVDAAGNEYRIPHDGCVIELAENVTAGKVRSMQKGSDLTPISFVVNETIVTLNPDPRIETKILGIAGREVDPSILAASLQVGDEVVIVGYLVGEHMLFGIEIDAPTLYVESMGIIVSADRFTARVDTGLLRWRGQLYPTAGKTLWVQLAGSKELIPVPFVVDPANGIGTYDMRLDGIDLEAVTALDMVVRDATTGAELQREHFDFTDSIAP
jgi:hypothetical protein